MNEIKDGKEERKKNEINERIINGLIASAEGIPSPKVVMLLIISKEADGIRFEPKLVRAFTNDDMMVELEKYVIGLGDPANYIG